MSDVANTPDLERFRTIVGERLGLQFDESRTGELADVLRRRMETTGLSAALYLAQLETSTNNRPEVRALAEKLTVGETFFFRYWDQCRAFGEAVLKACVQLDRPTSTIRILSAGCASGEEPYTLGMLAREHADIALPPVSIHAFDVNPAALQRATRAHYSTWSLRETPPDLRARYFRGDDRDIEVDAQIRRMVTFEERNLIDRDPVFWHAGAFEVVFCRNVTMYFKPEVARAVIARISHSLVPGGFLFLGHAETLRGLSNDFHLRNSHETFYYQRRLSNERAPETATQSQPPAVSPDSSWVEAIRRAADRIERLSQPSDPAPLPVVERDKGARSWDLAPAVALLKEERFADAMDLVTSLPPEAGGDVDAQILRAVLLTNSGRIPEAEDLCNQILAADDLNAGAHYLAALCREHAGDPAAATEHNRAATYLDATFVMPHLHLGILARRAGDLPRARAELSSALSLVGREDAARILLFGGGFSRDALAELCRAELRGCGVESPR